MSLLCLIFCPLKYLIVRFFFHFVSAVLVDIVVSQISIVVQKFPRRTVTECTEPSGLPGLFTGTEAGPSVSVHT